VHIDEHCECRSDIFFEGNHASGLYARARLADSDAMQFSLVFKFIFDYFF
jgi:hypothetical protein